MENPAGAADLAGLRVLLLDPFGPLICNDRDAADIMGEVFSQGARMVAIPSSRLASDFFVLRSRIAGEVIQKFITYEVRVAILGDIASYIEQSDALRDFVRESNRGAWVWFLEDRAALERRLSDAAQDRAL